MIIKIFPFFLFIILFPILIQNQESTLNFQNFTPSCLICTILVDFLKSFSNTSSFVNISSTNKSITLFENEEWNQEMASIYSELTESESLLVFIESGYLGIDICREFSFCSGKIKKKTDPAKCVACEMLEAEYTEYSKTQNISWSSNSQEIINDLPQQFQNELKQLIIEYPKIFEEMDYDFCSKSEICTLDLIFDAKPQSNPLINLDFIVCDAIINELIVFLNKNDKENIIQFLSSLCNYFPAQFQGSCTEIISQQKEAIVLVSLSYPNFLEKLCELLK